MPVVLDPYVATRFCGIIASMVNAEAVQKGKSLLAGKVGEQVASSCLSIVDQALLPDGIGSYRFDSEGVPAQNKTIIENGVLNTYLHNTYTAGKEGGKSTGNAQRGSFRGLPGVGSSNFSVVPGFMSRNTYWMYRARLYVLKLWVCIRPTPYQGIFPSGQLVW